MVAEEEWGFEVNKGEGVCEVGSDKRLSITIIFCKSDENFVTYNDPRAKIEDSQPKQVRDL